MTNRPLTIAFAMLMSVGIAGEVQAAGAPGDSAASLSIRAVNVKVVNSSACTLNAQIGIANRFVTKTLQPGDSVQFAGSDLPAALNTTAAKVTSNPDCVQQMRVNGVFTNPQIGEPFCLCELDSTTWQESFSENQSRALRDGTVGLVVQRNADSSKYKNFTLTISGNGEKALQTRPAPAYGVGAPDGQPPGVARADHPAARTGQGLAFPRPEAAVGGLAVRARNLSRCGEEDGPDRGAGPGHLPGAGLRGQRASR